MVLRILTNGMSSTLLYVTFELTSFSKSLCIYQMHSFLIPFFAYFIQGDPIRKWDIVALLSACIGMTLVVQPYKEDSSRHHELWRDLLGCFIAFIASLCAALGVVYI